MDPPIGDVVVNHAPVTYRIVEEGTKRRKVSLVDSVGFSYNIHSKRPYATYWQCTVRPKGKPCKASVIERNGVYQAGKSAHNHQIEAGCFIAAKVVAAVKQKALEEKFKPASAIVSEVCMQLVCYNVHNNSCNFVALHSLRNNSGGLLCLNLKEKLNTPLKIKTTHHNCS